jgi:hypothetical protein
LQCPHHGAFNAIIHEPVVIPDAAWVSCSKLASVSCTTSAALPTATIITATIITATATAVATLAIFFSSLDST